MPEQLTWLSVALWFAAHRNRSSRPFYVTEPHTMKSKSMQMTAEANTPVAVVWQQFLNEVCGPVEKWRMRGISSLSAPGSREFHLGYGEYRLKLSLKDTDIVASIEKQNVPLGGPPKVRRFRITGTTANPVIFDGQREWTFSEMFDDLLKWFCQAVDEHRRKK
jgi:hypothetical protein